MVNSIKIENLRSLKDTEFVQLKKLNILLGTNSSGKSTFLRSFPLFFQSVNKNLRGPISWFDDSFVDFGDYQTAKNKYSTDNENIRFSYKLNKPYVDYAIRGRHYINIIDAPDLGQIEVTISYANDSKGTYINKVSIIQDNVHYILSIKDRTDNVKVEVEGYDIGISKWKWDQNTRHGMLPSNEPVKIGERIYALEEWLHDNTLNNIKKYCDKRLKNDSKLYPVVIHWSNNKEEYLDYLQNRTKISSLKRSAKEWTVQNKDFLNFYHCVATRNLLTLMPLINSELTRFYEGCSYIAPMRAEANRFYRSQGLQVNDIDPYGRNLQEFISSLTSNQSLSYNKFCSKLLGITVSTVNTAGHYSIMLHNENGAFNMADVGFGYSQVLPIITKLWFSSNPHVFRRSIYYFSTRGINNKTILIEQPELHLHPAMQAKLADAFIETVNETNESSTFRDDFTNIRLIIETHSKAIINRIGRKVREGKIDPQDINIIIFQKDKELKNSIIKQISYDKSGRLTEWPYGFFDPND